MSDSASLAEALALAARDPATRPAFYRRLLAADVFVIGHSDGAGDGSSVLPAGAQLSLVHWGKPDGTTAIPFFTSLPALQQGLREEARYLSLSARSLFEMTRGATLVLDPASDYGKEFTPGEVDALLANGGHPTAVQRTVAEDTQVLLGQPAHYPTAMIEALSHRLPAQPTVEAAYLCLMHDPQQSPAPSLVVGLAVDGELAPVLHELGAVAAATVPDGQALDFVRVVHGEGGLSAYLLDEVTPFYRRDA